MQVGQLNKFKDQTSSFEVYCTLEDNHELQILLLSKVDDEVYSKHISNEHFPENCRNMFQNVAQIFEFLSGNIKNDKAIDISQTGIFKMIEVIVLPGRQIKLECHFQCLKQTEIAIIKELYLKMIKFHRQNPQPKSTIAVSSLKSYLKKAEKMILTVDFDNNPSFDLFSKYQNKVKIEGYSKFRIKLYFNQIIPRQGCHSMSVRLGKSKVFAFALGIIDKNEDRKIQKSPHSISYEFRSGQIKDSKFNKEEARTHWRLSSKSNASLLDATLKMKCNMDEQRVSFYCNDQWVNETLITNYLMDKDMVVYFSCKHQGDEFIINQQ